MPVFPSENIFTGNGKYLKQPWKKFSRIMEFHLTLRAGVSKGQT